ITSSAGDGGSISPSGNVSVNHGSNQSFTITPTTGYSISDVKVDNVSQGAISTYTFTNVTAPHTISATFTLNSYTISTSSSPSEGGTTSGGGTYNHGASVSLVAIASTGYTFVNWTENGTQVSTNSTYTFTANNSRTLVANFLLNELTVTPTKRDVTYKTGSTTFSVTSNTSWNVSESENWITSLSPMSGTNDDTITVNYNENTGASREGMVTVSGGGITRIVKVTQAANPPFLVISQGEINHNFGSFEHGSNPDSNNFSFEISNSGGGTLEGNIEITGNWLKLDHNEFNLNHNQTKIIQITADLTNLGIGSYSDSIKISSNGGNKNGEISCNLITGIEDLSNLDGIPKNYFLENNYPNPFNPSTIIRFGLPTPSTVSLIVYDIAGNEVEKFLNNERLPAGTYQYSFDTKKLASGIYFYRILTDKFMQTKKMIFLK
ncbi:MAG: T9SS type A sorting domain-containing protein, partial [Ignavibacteriales bacterium]|nr:T9SS type A sorting domain-containing protein [Ignavibacteriales bacterium]